VLQSPQREARAPPPSQRRSPPLRPRRADGPRRRPAPSASLARHDVLAQGEAALRGAPARRHQRAPAAQAAAAPGEPRPGADGLAALQPCSRPSPGSPLRTPPPGGQGAARLRLGPGGGGAGAPGRRRRRHVRQGAHPLPQQAVARRPGDQERAAGAAGVHRLHQRPVWAAAVGRARQQRAAAGAAGRGRGRRPGGRSAYAGAGAASPLPRPAAGGRAGGRPGQGQGRQRGPRSAAAAGGHQWQARTYTRAHQGTPACPLQVEVSCYPPGAGGSGITTPASSRTSLDDDRASLAGSSAPAGGSFSAAGGLLQAAGRLAPRQLRGCTYTRPPASVACHCGRWRRPG
jgi:hypothetical protein